MTILSKKNINRPFYLEKIRPFYNKQLIKILTGQRRVGKSKLLIQIQSLLLVKILTQRKDLR